MLGYVEVSHALCLIVMVYIVGQSIRKFALSDGLVLFNYPVLRWQQGGNKHKKQ